MWLFFQPSFPQVFKQLLQKYIPAAEPSEDLEELTEGLTNDSSVQ